MNLHFITSISPEYWNRTAKYCISTWNLPGKVTVYVDQKEGSLNWLDEVPYNKVLIDVPHLNFDSEESERAKVRKFWGKSYCQINTVLEREKDERIIWLDADIEQTTPNIDPELFNFGFTQEIAVMNSKDGFDCWESGIVIFNNEAPKLKVAINRYINAWNSEEILNSLWKPYDAQVLGYVASDRGYFNLCEAPCKNIDALKNTRYKDSFNHWINKTNKQKLFEKYNNEDSDISYHDTEQEES